MSELQTSSSPNSSIESSAARDIILVIAVLCTIILHSVTALKFPAVDLQDELVYLDQLVKVTEFDLGQTGDFYSKESVEEICRRNGQTNHPIFPLDYTDRCNSADPVAAFGVNYSWPLPVYFVATGLVTKVIVEGASALGLELSIVSVARLLGSLWFALGLIISYFVVKRLGHNPILVAPLGLAVAGFQSVLHQQTIVNADASSFALGALLFLLTLRYLDGATRLVTLTLTAVLVSLATNHHLVILLGCGLFLLLSAFRKRAEESSTLRIEKRPFLGSLGAGFAIVFSSLLWRPLVSRFGGVIYGAPDTDPAPIIESLRAQYRSEGFRWFQMLSAENATTFLVPSWDAFQPAQRFGGPYQTAAWLAVILFSAGVVGAALSKHDHGLVRRVATVHIVVALSMPILFVMNWNIRGVNDNVQPRFAISNFVLLITCAAVLYSERRTTRVIVWVVCSTTFVVAFLTNFVDFV
jgi:hypothetical protein